MPDIVENMLLNFIRNEICTCLKYYSKFFFVQFSTSMSIFWNILNNSSRNVSCIRKIIIYLNLKHTQIHI